mmetsp:Transcript_25213/g.54494  ORF Transcript_25213/g.54494 Transcript_25213/m.54494 type:complete len:203 (+) Transcript_25213:590-1198(+)
MAVGLDQHGREGKVVVLVVAAFSFLVDVVVRHGYVAGGGRYGDDLTIAGYGPSLLWLLLLLLMHNFVMSSLRRVLRWSGLDRHFLPLDDGRRAYDPLIAIVFDRHLKLPIVDLGGELNGGIIAGRELHHVVVLGIQFDPVVGWRCNLGRRHRCRRHCCSGSRCPRRGGGAAIAIIVTGAHDGIIGAIGGEWERRGSFERLVR